MEARFKVVVTDAETATLPIEQHAVEQIGGRLVVGNCSSEEDVIELAGDADAVLYDYAPITARVIDAFDRCRVIVRYGVGLDRIDLAAAEAKGIEVRYLPGWSAEEVSDHVMALAFGLARKLLPLDRWVREGHWGYAGERNTVRIVGKRVGLIGFGSIARRVAAKANGLGMEVVAYDPYVEPCIFEAARVRSTTLNQLLAGCDFVSLHVPLNEATAGMLGREEFDRMRDGAFVINTARGGVLDESALVDALREGKLAGAGLDVFADEPPPSDSPLFDLDSVILTPHMACYSERSMDEMHEMAIKHVVDVLGKENDDRS